MNDLLKTVLGKDIPTTTRGLLFLCKLNYKEKSIQIINEIAFDSAFNALNAYANIPNPESQLIQAGSFNELIKQKKILLENMNKKEWIDNLMEYI